MTTDKILQHALGMKLRTGLGMLVIDYLGILDDQYGRTPYERITRISRQLKNDGQDFGCAGSSGKPAQPRICDARR